MIDKIEYNCMKCGICCFDVPGYPGAKRIPLYPEEVDLLIALSKKIKKENDKEFEFSVMEDLVFPDVLNKKILIITYKIRFNVHNSCCPFYDQKMGCIIHDLKPHACQAYPLSLKQTDAFNFEISIDPSCNFVSSHYDSLKSSNMEHLKEIFKREYPKAQKLYNKNKKIILKIRRLEYEKKIEIPKEISIDNYNKALKEWDRIELRVL